MSFSSGFKDGFNYYMSLVDKERKDKLTESQLEIDQLRRESYQSTINFNEERLRLSQTTPEELEAKPPEKRSYSEIELISKAKADALNLDKLELDLDTADINNQVAQAQLDSTLAAIEDQEAKDALAKVININRRLSSGKINSTVAASLLEEPIIVLREAGIFDFTKYGDEDYVRGWERIAPKLEAGDLESIATNDADVLTNIFKEPLNVYKGKTFVAADGRKGIIESVALNGTFDAIPQSANTLVGGTFNVKFEGSDEATEVFSYLPDNARSLSEIKEDRTSTDAKVVSVADIVDRVSAEKEFMMFAINNPAVMDTIIEAGKGATNYKGDPDKVEKMVNTHFDIKQRGEEHIGTVMTAANKAREEAAASMIGNPQSAFLQVYYLKENEIASDFIEQVPGELEGEFEYALIEGRTIDGLQDRMVEKYANPAKIYGLVADAYNIFEEVEDMGGRKPFYFYKGENFRFDTKKEELDAQLRLLEGESFEQIKEGAAERYESIYGVGSFDTITDEVYLSYMTAYLEKLNRGR